ncbi:MAG: radical SAM protein [Minisyncoccales bacterium]|jgi:MoaA/NifB/PqqE/SkfB family radical SAM enzyme
MKGTEIKLGYNCENHCLFCIQGDMRLSEPDLSIDELKERLKKGKDEGIVNVVLTGGEPTLRSDILIESIKFAKEIGYQRIEIQSNGVSFASEDLCKKVVEAGSDQVSVSIHGSSAQEHDTLTLNNGSWEAAIKGLKILKKMGCRLKTNTVVNKMNYQNLPDLVKLLFGTGVDEIQLSFINPVFAQDDQKLTEKLLPRISEVALRMEKALDVAEETGADVRVAAIPFCLLEDKYHKYIFPEAVPILHKTMKRLEIRDNKSPYEIDGKYKKAECIDCRYFTHCDGLWTKYKAIFGDDEISPITK